MLWTSETKGTNQMLATFTLIGIALLAISIPVGIAFGRAAADRRIIAGDRKHQNALLAAGIDFE